MARRPFYLSFFFFNDTATTEIYTLSLHDALPISDRGVEAAEPERPLVRGVGRPAHQQVVDFRSEEHTSELQSQSNLVCRLLLEKKKKKQTYEDALQANTPRNSSTRPRYPHQSGRV